MWGSQVPAYLIRNIPLQPLGRRQHSVGIAQAVPSVRIAQMEGVSGQDKLQGGQALRLLQQPLPACPLWAPF